MLLFQVQAIRDERSFSYWAPKSGHGLDLFGDWVCGVQAADGDGGGGGGALRGYERAD